MMRELPPAQNSAANRAKISVAPARPWMRDDLAFFARRQWLSHVHPMNLRVILSLSCLVASVAFAADLPAIPEEPIAKKKELLFSDDFSKAEPAKEWHKVVPTFAFENGMLKGTQTRDKNIPASEGQKT